MRLLSRSASSGLFTVDCFCRFYCVVDFSSAIRTHQLITHNVKEDEKIQNQSVLVTKELCVSAVIGLEMRVDAADNMLWKNTHQP